MSPALLGVIWLALAAQGETDTPPSSPPPSSPPSSEAQQPAPTVPSTPAPAPPAASAPPAAPEPSISDAYNAAQAQQGALDGEWRLNDATGHTLYIFELSDPGGGELIEGAWRSPDKLGSADSSGFLESVRDDDDWLEIRLAGGLFPPTVVLKPNPAGGWKGDLIHDGPRRAVVMIRSPRTSP